MVRRFFLSIIVAGVLTAAMGQPTSTPIVNIEHTRPNGQKVLLGHCTPHIMKSGIYQEWYERYYDSYVVDTNTAGQLAPLLDGKVIEIFAGSWCGDTRREIPRLMKILEAHDFDTAQLRLVFVDNSKELYKQSPQHEEAGKFIHHIPTIIIYDNDKEVNRIIEKPMGSLEQDLFTILSGKPYTPHYHAITTWQQAAGIDRELSTDQLQRIADAVKDLPAGAREFNSYAVALSIQGKEQEAANVLRLNTLLYPNDPTSYLSLGKLYKQLGDTKLAKANLNKVLALQPDNEEARELLLTLSSP